MVRRGLSFFRNCFILDIAVGIDIVVNWNDVLRQKSLRRFKAHKGYSCMFPQEFS
jgi:hypothetical protein